MNASELALKNWVKTQPLPVSSIEEHGFINGYNWAMAQINLSDEEIIKIANGCLEGATAWHNPELDIVKFARAILKKAQEK